MCVDSMRARRRPKFISAEKRRAAGRNWAIFFVGKVPTNAPNGAHMAHMAHSEPRQANALVSTPMSVDPDARPLLPAAA